MNPDNSMSTMFAGKTYIQYCSGSDAINLSDSETIDSTLILFSHYFHKSPGIQGVDWEFIYPNIILNIHRN